MQDVIDQILEAGYARLKNQASTGQVADALARTKQLHAQGVAQQSDRVPRLNRAQPMVYNLQNKDVDLLKLMLGNEKLESVLVRFLNDQWFAKLPDGAPNYILRSLLARSSNARLPMHIDSFVPYLGEHVFVMQCALLLEDQTAANGCTVLVPGSHRANAYATPASFEDAVPIEAEAGDMIVWDSRIWHGAHANDSGGTRWSMIATFCRWWVKQAFDIPGNLPQSIYDQLTDREKAVLGYCSVPYDDETFGIDMKRGYDLLPANVEDYRK